MPTYKTRKRLKPAIVTASSAGNRGCVKLDQQAQLKLSSNIKVRNKGERSLQKFGQGITKGKQKTKGTSKPPVAHSKTSQAHIDVFYVGASKKWGVAPPPIDPLKTCNVKPRHKE